MCIPVQKYASLLLQGAKSTTNIVSVSFYASLYVIDVVLFIPIAKILKSDDETSLSGEIFKSIGAFDVGAEDEIFSMVFYSEDANVRSLLSTSSIAGTLFGVVHCLAWYFSFPSHVEQVMWRTASLGLVVSCVATLYTVVFRELNFVVYGFWYAVTEKLLSLGFALCGLSSFVYPVARITILVLAMVSLRSLPTSAFDTIDWVEFVPHI